jgi:uncharacterized protein YjbI with pentapeptide repeats
MGDYGTFAGKTTFGSAAPGRSFYLTSWVLKDGAATLRLPAMLATSAGEVETCLLYEQAGGALKIQLGDLYWISLDENLGWLMLTAEFTGAAAFTLSGSPLGQIWEVHTTTGPKRVVYTVNNASPILTVNASTGDLDRFVPLSITPSLEEIRRTRKAISRDLRSVNLAGEDLSDVDFTQAKAAESVWRGATLARATLIETDFSSATLHGIRCDDATLDRAILAKARLEYTTWGKPKSAVRIVLTGCFARNAVLGGHTRQLDFTEANLAGGDFRQANLSNLLLARAECSGALLALAKLDMSVFEGAKLAEAIATGASLKGANLRGIEAPGAVFVRANLSGADLTRARLGAKAWLFPIEGRFAAGLDTRPFVQPDLIAEFQRQGVTLQPADAVQIVALGERWLIADVAGPYALYRNPQGEIDVFRASANLRPAVLRGAICLGTKAPRASLAGADLRGVEWYNSPATLDHADLEGAMLSGSLFVQTDFTQAHLSGADLSDCVLVQASFVNCLITAGDNRRPLSMEGSYLQGAIFSEATLVGTLLTGASIATARGVPLFRLPLSALPNLTPQGLPELAPDFSSAGYPLGTGATISEEAVWLLDNAADPTPTAPREYEVRRAGTELRVYNAGTGKFLFPLAASFERDLSLPHADPELRSAFTRRGFSLAENAPIQPRSFWQILVGSDALGNRPVSYPRLRVFKGPDYLPAYGSVLVNLRDWPQYRSGLAFAGTRAIEQALNPACLGPAGYPRSWVEAGLLDWEEFLTVPQK